MPSRGCPVPPEGRRWGPAKSCCVNGFAGGPTVVWCSGSAVIVTGATNTAAHDPGLSAVTTQKTGGPWWMAYAKNWMTRRRNQQNSVYLHSSIEGAAGSFRQLVEASRALVDDLTPVRVLDAAEASLVLNELTNRPGSFWEGATGSGMNWRLAVSELEAERRRPIFYRRFTGSMQP